MVGLTDAHRGRLLCKTSGQPRNLRERAAGVSVPSPSLAECVAAGDEGLLTADQIAAKTSGLRRGEVPLGCNHLTMFIDVHDRLLYWMVAAWEQAFSRLEHSASRQAAASAGRYRTPLLALGSISMRSTYAWTTSRVA